MKYIVYKTTCIYIGYHQTSNPEVFDGYLGCGLYKQHNEYIKHPKTAFHHAVVKYGVDNFKRDKLNRYTLDGKYIDSFESAAQAKKVLGLKLASISQANRQCNGFRWTRTDSPTETINISH